MNFHENEYAGAHDDLHGLAPVEVRRGMCVGLVVLIGVAAVVIAAGAWWAL